MPEHIRALIAILALAAPVWWVLRRPACVALMSEGDFEVRRNLWLGLTVAAFVSMSFWIYAIVAVAAIAMYGRRDSNPMALFVVLLFVVPPFTAQIPGFGVLNYLADVTHLRLIALAILLPAWLSYRCRNDMPRFGRSPVDWCVLGYGMLALTQQAMIDSPTNTIRYAVYWFVDVMLPYRVASVYLRSARQVREVLAVFVIAAVVMVPIALFEYIRHWLLYSSLPSAMGVRWGMGGYLLRGDSLRVLASTGHSLVLGYILAVAIGLFISCVARVQGQRIRWGAWAGLVLALMATVSRGPWVGAVVVVLILILTSAERGKKLLLALATAVPLLGVLLMTPYADKLIDLLPWVGTVDDFNVQYRERLFTISILVIKSNLWFGSPDYIAAPLMQELIQGEGIVDIVNSYIGIALSHGLVGLGLFCGAFAWSLWGVWSKLASDRADEESHAVGRALLAATVGTLVIIATVSSINAIPVIYWMLAGLGVAYARLPATRSVRHAAQVGATDLRPRPAAGRSNAA